MVNRVMGALWVTPLTVGELSEEWLDVFEAVYRGAPVVNKLKVTEEKAFEDFRKRAGYKKPNG